MFMENLKVRNLKNNNPANLKRSSSWKGLVSFLEDPFTHQRSFDKVYCQFSSMAFGVRALVVVVRKLVYRKKLCTISSLLLAFRPLSDCNTYAYIADVCLFIKHKYNINGEFGELLIDSEQRYCLFSNPKTLTFFGRCFIKAILNEETGFVCTDELLDEALSLL